MSNSSKQHTAGVRDEVQDVNLDVADALSKTGSIASSASKTQSQAGRVIPAQPDFLSFDSLLVRALESFGPERPRLAAAGVYSRMRNLDPAFTYRAAGFSSFRNLLETAEARGTVIVDRPEGASDVFVRSADGGLPLDADEPQGGDGTRIIHVNDDLWRALLDWRPEARYAFDRETGRTAATRARDLDAAQIVVPSVSQEQHRTWMAAFADSDEAGEYGDILKQALEVDAPVQAFSRALRDSQWLGRQWKRFLKKRVVDHVMIWADANEIPYSAIEKVRARSSNRVGVTAPGVTPSSSALSSGGETPDAAVRARILAILQAMPTSELMRLSIPVEYALGR